MSTPSSNTTTGTTGTSTPSNNVSIEVELTDYAKDILQEILGTNQSNLLNQIINFISTYLSQAKLEQYASEIQSIVSTYGKEAETDVEQSFEILVSIKNIIEDLYNYLESIKGSLPKVDRTFAANNIGTIQQTVVVLAIDHLKDAEFISKDALVKILSFVNSINNLSINMKVSSFFPLSCFKSTSTATSQ